MTPNNPMIIRGKIVEGLREAGNFTQVSWVRQQFIEKLSIDPYPGTLNLEVIPEHLARFETLKKTRGREIVPEDPSFCSARCYSVLVGGRLKGAIVFPLVEDYPKDKMELIASQNIKEAFHLKTGNFVDVEIISPIGQ